MTTSSSTIRLRAGASGVLVFVAVLIFLGFILTSDLELPGQAIERGAVDTILPNLAANTTEVALLVWGEVFLWSLIAIFGIDLYRILPDRRSGLFFAPLAILAATTLIIIELLLLLGISHGLAPAYAGTTGAEQTAIEGTALTLLRFRNRMILLAGVLFALAAIIYGREMRRSTEFPGWLGYVGYAAGAVGLIGGLFPLYVPLLVVRSLGLFLFTLWAVLAGIILLRSRSGETSLDG